MGLMYARKLAAKKAIEANKARAHRRNHAAAHAAFAKEEEARKLADKPAVAVEAEAPAPKATGKKA